MVTRLSRSSTVPSGGGRLRLPIALLTLSLLGTVATPLHAAGPDESALDAATLSQMEQRAQLADAKEQCYLYTEVLHGLTELAGRQMAAGESESAAATMREVDQIAAKVNQSSTRNAKRLKNAEQLMEHTTHRLADMVRAASSEERQVMQSTLQHLNAVHDSLLAMVFAH